MGRDSPTLWPRMLVNAPRWVFWAPVWGPPPDLPEDASAPCRRPDPSSWCELGRVLPQSWVSVSLLSTRGHGLAPPKGPFESYVSPPPRAVHPVSDSTLPSSPPPGRLCPAGPFACLCQGRLPAVVLAPEAWIGYLATTLRSRGAVRLSPNVMQHSHTRAGVGGRALEAQRRPCVPWADAGLLCVPTGILPSLGPGLPPGAARVT